MDMCIFDEAGVETRFASWSFDMPRSYGFRTVRGTWTAEFFNFHKLPLVKRRTKNEPRLCA